nr:glucose-6-phosphate isomerase [Tissierella sp.]
MDIKFNYEDSFIDIKELENIKPFIKMSHKMLHEKSGAGNDFLGFIDLPKEYDKDEFNRVKDAAEKIRKDSDVLIVIGIGGSYLGARACIDALSHNFYSSLDKEKRKSPEIYYLGNSISTSYIIDLLEAIEGKDISVNIISKSGTTTEPAIAFRFMKEFMEEKYGREEAKNRIYATTDREKGALKELADIEGYESFIIPDDVGGRFSVLTPVGLLPIAAAGIDIDAMMEGALSGMEDYANEDLENNEAYKYAAVRNILYKKGKQIEILVNYEPALNYFSEWWKQLYGESEGKDGKGLFPASVNFTTDLHSMGQYIQDGRRNLFETIINIEKQEKDLFVKATDDNLDGLNFLEGKSLDYINKKAMEGTKQAHINGGVPNLVLSLPKLNAFYIGKLIYFFEKACALSGYLLGVNPFDQPGVEEYKKNMFMLLEKPGY